jgi:O-antigen/teichoic acid export membrane protein
MLWLLLIIGVLIVGFAVPRIGKVVVRLCAILLALVILTPFAVIVTFQRTRLRRRRRNQATALAAAEGSERLDREESPHLGRVIASQ